MSTPPLRRPGLGFGPRIAALFAFLALLLAWLGLRVSLLVDEMHVEVRRVVEEHREAGYSRDMLHEMRILAARLADLRGNRPDEEHARMMLEFVSEAEGALGELRRGPLGRDPSRAEHIDQERRLFEALESGFAEVRRAIETRSPELADSVALALRHAEVLNDEMRSEALESSAEVRDDARGVRSAVLWTTAAALIVLGFVLWMVWRFVVAPVQSLRTGVGRIAGGDLQHRVEVLTHDEIGELAAEFNRMADELQGMRAELESRVEQRTAEFLGAARLAGLGTMAAGIAHEINNPLASIASCAEGLERRLAKGALTPEAQREYLQIIATEAYRAHEITSRLLEFARSEGGPKVRFALADLMRELRVLLEHHLRARRIELRTECAADVPPLDGNPSECKQVLLNLIHNAIDASPDGGVVRVACSRAGGEALLEVEDQGPGVPAELVGRIFDPFFTTKAPGKGTGLGLAIVYRIVTGHGGRVEVENTGRGALFRVRMPMETA